MSEVIDGYTDFIKIIAPLKISLVNSKYVYNEYNTNEYNFTISQNYTYPDSSSEYCISKVNGKNILSVNVMSEIIIHHVEEIGKKENNVLYEIFKAQYKYKFDLEIENMEVFYKLFYNIPIQKYFLYTQLKFTLWPYIRKDLTIDMSRANVPPMMLPWLVV